VIHFISVPTFPRLCSMLHVQRKWLAGRSAYDPQEWDRPTIWR
jgi:hypothetical protein